MNTERFAAGVMPILFNHKRDAVVGKPTRIWTESAELTLRSSLPRLKKQKKSWGSSRTALFAECPWGIA